MFFMLGKRPEPSQSKLTRRAQSKCNREELTWSKTTGRTDGRTDGGIRSKRMGRKREREKIMLAKTSEIQLTDKQQDHSFWGSKY